LIGDDPRDQLANDPLVLDGVVGDQTRNRHRDRIGAFLVPEFVLSDIHFLSEAVDQLLHFRRSLRPTLVRACNVDRCSFQQRHDPEAKMADPPLIPQLVEQIRASAIDVRLIGIRSVRELESRQTAEQEDEAHVTVSRMFRRRGSTSSIVVFCRRFVPTIDVQWFSETGLHGEAILHCKLECPQELGIEMSADSNSAAPTEPTPPPAEPMPSNIRSIQPGGGTVMRLELLWGKFRRWRLRNFHPEYVAASKARLKGDPISVPVDVIDSRDLKYCRNVAGCWFDPADDIYAWRKSIPMATDGFFELVMFTAPCFIIAHVIYWWLGGWWNLLTIPLVLLGLFVLSFFRDPHRLVTTDADAIVSPADGKVVDVEEVIHKGVSDDKAIRVGIFLSVFNVHVNRSPLSGRVLSLRYRQGQFLDARNTDATLKNENLEVVLAETAAPYRRFAVRQVAGAIARRIVCELRPGQIIERGQRYGMIKFGSRTEIYLPKSAATIDVRVGQMVYGGSTILGRWKAPTPEDFQPKPKIAVEKAGPPPIDEEPKEPPPIPLAGEPAPNVVPPTEESASSRNPSAQDGYGLASH
jgi:phosphatidylserine decarboxylase